MDELENTTIIFNHVPKTGGTSLMKFFQQLFGVERCFRHRAREGKTGKISPAIESLSEEDLASYNFIQGHFDYGHHRRVPGPVKYISVIRDPIERLVSDYYFNRSSGRQDLKEIALSKSLDDYAQEKLANPKSRLGRSGQIEYISGGTDLERAKDIIETNYLACSSIDQIDRMQEYLSCLYGRPDLGPQRVNETRNKSGDNTGELSEGTLSDLRKAYETDYRLLDWVTHWFDQKTSELR